jgi:NAD(P)-dependent dehydrogenase (short-subunit alcohol dehydrogenase family)
LTQTVLITGASAGVGRATAQLYGRRGARVGLLARGQAGLDGAVADVQEAGGQALAVPADVADYDQVKDAARKVEEALGPIDVWINVAFTSVFAPFWEIRPGEFKRVTEVSYLGFVYGTQVDLELMRPRDHGTIVQVGSALGSRSIPLQSAYCGAKHAINGLPPRCAPSSCTTTAPSASPSPRCPQSTPPSSPGCCHGFLTTPSPSP